MKIANVVRTISGLVLLAGGATNAFLASIQPEVYTSFANMSLIPLYWEL